MPTIMLQHSETRTISIAAPRDTVLDVIGEAERLPDWAPAFAQGIKAHGPHWLVESGGTQLSIDVRVDRAAGTVDLLDAGRPTRGAFLRVIPNGDAGSEVIFTVFFPEDTEQRTISEQMATIEKELDTVRSLCER